MISTYPLLYDSEISLPQLQMLKSSKQEWMNVQKEALNRGLQNPTYHRVNSQFAKSTASNISINNSGIPNQDLIILGKVFKPDQYNLISDSQAYLTLIREMEREPTFQDYVDYSPYVGLDERLIGPLKEEVERVGNNIYATESESFQRIVQKSLNNYAIEKNMYKTSMQLQESQFGKLTETLKELNIKNLESRLLKPINEFRQSLRKVAPGLKITANVVKGLAQASGFPMVSELAESISNALSSGIDIDRVLSHIESDQQQSVIATIINQLRA